MVKLHIGCWRKIKEGYHNIDLYHGPIKMDMFDLKYPDRSVEHILTHHTLEHAGHGLKGHRGVAQALAEWFRVLKPGGTIEVVVPDSEKCAKRWLKSTEIDDYSNMQIWGHQQETGHYHLCGFKKSTIAQYFKKAGFTDIKVDDFKPRKTPSIIVRAKKP